MGTGRNWELIDSMAFDERSLGVKVWSCEYCSTPSTRNFYAVAFVPVAYVAALKVVVVLVRPDVFSKAARR